MICVVVGAACLVLGYTLGALTAPQLPRAVQRGVSRMRHTVWQFVKSHVAGIAVIGFTLTVLVGWVGYYEYGRLVNRIDDRVSCSTGYLNGSASLTGAYQDALQHTLADVSASRALRNATDRNALSVVIARLNDGVLQEHPLALDATLPHLQHALTTQLFRDLDAEQAAYRVLANYRAHHVPKHACPE